MVAVVERSAQRRRNRSRPGTNLHHMTVVVVAHHDSARVARQAPGRFRGNVRAVLEDGLALLIGVSQHRGIDVDHHLIALSRRAGIEPVMQGGFREQGEGVRLLLAHRRAVLHAELPANRLARRFQRPHEQRPHFRRQPSPHHDHAVCGLIHMKRTALVLPGALTVLNNTIHAPPASHDALDVLGGAGAPHRQQPLFGFRRGHAGERAHLGVRDSPRASAPARRGSVPSARATRTFSRAAPMSSPTRQLSQAAHERNPFAQPSRASNSRMRSSRRAVAASRCADSTAISSPSRSSSAIGSGVARMVGDWMLMARPLLVGRLYTLFSEPPARRQERRSRTNHEFFSFGYVRCPRRPVRAAEPAFPGTTDNRASAVARSCQAGNLRW